MCEQVVHDGAKEVVAIEDRWYSPGATYFRVLMDEGDRYLLRLEEAQDVWTLTGYRAASMIDTKIVSSV
jgi:hypothetical protein